MKPDHIKLIYTIMFFLIGIYSIYRGIRAIKTRNLYWTAPTISGFKNRRNEKEPFFASILTGFSTIFIGIIAIIASILFWL